jgi:uncharacterized protein (TIGR03437 family)
LVQNSLVPQREGHMPTTELTMFHIARWLAPALVAPALLFSAAPHEQAVPHYGMLPLAFEANRGQFDPGVRFLARGEGYSLFLTDAGAVFSLSGAPSGASVRMAFAHVSGTPILQPLDQLPGKSNYFLGDASRWRTGVPNYARVAYRGLYPGVTVIFYGNQRQVEYDLVLRPGVNPDLVRIDFQGCDSVRIDEQGDVLLQTPAGELRQRNPSILQEKAGERRQIRGRYVLYGKSTVGVKVTDYDRTLPLAIDPVLIYSTFLGGDASAVGGVDVGRAIAVDAAGNTYVAGSTEASAFPTSTGALARTYGGSTDGFITKLDPSGAVVYSTFLGGAGSDQVRAIAVDLAGDAYVAGFTNSSGFPTTANAFQRTFKGEYDAFVARLNAAGSALIYSTLLGGTSEDRAYALKLNSAGEAYVAGQTWSSNFPVSGGAYQSALRLGSDAFVAKVSADGSGLVYSTLLGGNGDDLASTMALDSSGFAYVAGQTLSSDFPVTANAPRKSGGGSGDGFVAKLNAEGSALAYSTLVGGWSSDGVRGLALDGKGQVYLVGVTASSDFPVKRSSSRVTPHRTVPPRTGPLPGWRRRLAGQQDGFLLKLSSDGSSFLSGLYLGSGGDDYANAVAVTPGGTVVVAGETSSSDMLTSPGARQGSYGGGAADAFIATFRADDLSHVHMSYLGGSDEDRAYALAVDDTGNVCLTGMTKSRNFPVSPGAYQSSRPGGGSDAFVTRLRADGSDFIFSTFLGGGGSSTAEEGLDITADAAGNAYITGATTSSNFPVSDGAVQPAFGGGTGTDAFVTKLDPTGSHFLFSTYLGGTGNDLGSGIAVDAAGNVYVTGVAGYGGFPVTQGAFQKQLRGNFDVFLAKLSPDGSKLLFSTYLGGSRDEGIERFFPRVAVDGAGLPYVAGITESTDFPVTAGAFQRTLGGGRDSFVTKFKADGSGLVYSTYLGGNGSDDLHGFAVDSSGQAYIAGATDSNHTTFPTTPGAYQSTYGGSGNVFIAKLNSDGTGLVYSTFFGGSNYDGAYRLALDAAGAVYIVGATSSPDFPTTPGSGFAGSAYGTYFVAKLNSAGSALDFSNRFMIADLNYYDLGIALDPSGGVLVTGQTSAQGLPATDDAPQVALVTAPDGFVMRFGSNGTTVTYATYLGGGGADKAEAIAVDSAGNAYISGQTGSANFLRTSGVAQSALGGLRNAFATKLDLTRTVPVQRPIITAVVNYASKQAVLAPGAIVTITGHDLATDTIEAGSPLEPRTTSLPTTLANAVVSAAGRNLPLFSVSPTKIVAQLPYGTPAEAAAYLLVYVNGISSRPFQIDVRTMAVGILAVYKTDLSPNSAANKLTAGDTLIAYVTGGGLTSPTVTSGIPSPAATANVVQQPERINMNKPETPMQGTGGQLQSFTLVPGLVGVAQARILIPPYTEPGAGDQLDLVIGWKNVDSNPYRIYVVQKID